jgi:transposase
MEAGNLVALGKEVKSAQKKLQVGFTAPVKSCYEAGLDGFWLHRYLTAQEIANVVVDSSSIPVNRRAKRAKTDRLDVRQLLAMLIRYHSGEDHVWKVVHVPSVAAEDQRHLHRQLLTCKKDRTRHSNRIYGVLATYGVKLKVGADFLAELDAVRQWNGEPLPPGLQARVRREYALLQYVRQQIRELEAQRRALIATGDTAALQQVRALMRLRAIGENGAWLLVMEFFAWRKFRNRREVGGLAGLTPMPYQSGSSYQEQGISKAGSRRVRAMMIELAWSWLRYQPDSELSRWYRERFDGGGKRMRKVGIVALARKLLIALWRYLETGVVPAGARLKPVQ